MTSLSKKFEQHKIDMRANGWLLPGEDAVPESGPIQIYWGLLIWVRPYNPPPKVA